MKLKDMMDVNKIGGTALLGISKPVIKAHGSSDAKAFKNAIRQAIAYADSEAIYDLALCIQRFNAHKKAEQEQQAQEQEPTQQQGQQGQP